MAKTMPRGFRFRLSAVKKYRETRLLLARKDLGEIEARLQKLKEDVREAHSARSGLLEAMRTDSGVGTRLETHLVETETLKMRALEAKIRLMEGDRERHAKWVTHLGRELKAIEKLEERKCEEYEKQLRLIEKKQMDGWVADRWIHSPQAQRQEFEEESS